MKAVELKNQIYWVGAVDWAVRDFHGYVTKAGVGALVCCGKPMGQIE